MNHEEKARERRVGRLLFLLDLARTAYAGEPLAPIDLLRSKKEWLTVESDPVRRWTKLSSGDPVFQRRPPSEHTCLLADAALDGQLQVLFMFDVAQAEAATN